MIYYMLKKYVSVKYYETVNSELFLNLLFSYPPPIPQQGELPTILSGCY